MGLKYTKRAMTSYEVHRFFHGLEISFFPDTFLLNEEREMHYFITSQENLTPSAIEIAQMQRVHYW